MNDNNYLNKLIETLKMLIPNDSDSYLEIGGHIISVSNHDGNINIAIEQTFDDTQIKELVSNYKRNIEKLDDCLFLEILDEIKDCLDMKTFDLLINQDSYSEEDAEIVKSMIEFTSFVIQEHLTNKIEDLKNLFNQFLTLGR